MPSLPIVIILFVFIVDMKKTKLPTTQRLNLVGNSYWHATDSLILNGIDIGVQMNLIQLSSGRFVVLDTITLNQTLIDEINYLTKNGSLIDAVLGTHPFHTLYFPAFYKQYPNANYYGTPRHLRVIPSIPWAGSLYDCTNRNIWPDIKMRIPRGSEFVNPQPESTNHFSGIHVFHPASGILHVDDTIDIIFGVMAFHPSIFTVGLYHIYQGPQAFGIFVQGLIDDWDFDKICVAHKSTPFCNINAKNALQTLLDLSKVPLVGLEAKYALDPSPSDQIAFNQMQIHENNPECSGL